MKNKKIYVSPILLLFGSGADIILGYSGQTNERDSATCKNCAGYAGPTA